MPALHQFVPTIEPGATGAHVLEIQRLMKSRGWRSEIFFYEAKPPFEDAGHPYRAYDDSYAADASDLLLYHVAIGSPIAEWLMARTERLLLYFHNITPPEYYDRWEPFIAYACTWGRTQMRRLAPRAYFAMAASRYSQDELLDAGYLDTAVVPIMLDGVDFKRDVDNSTLVRLETRKRDGGAEWLFVSRVCPNKVQEDIIKAFAAYRSAYDANARLSLVGGIASGLYRDALRSFANAAGLNGAVEITGGVPPAVRNAYYRAADVFVCLSEHEGFGVPILEAWHHDLPVVAYSSTAIAEMAHRAAVVLDDKAPEPVAAAVHRVLTDDALRADLATAARARLADYDIEHARERFLTVIDRVHASL